MIKQIIKFNYIVLFFLLTFSNAFAHHDTKDVYDKIVTGKKETLKQEYCIADKHIKKNLKEIGNKKKTETKSIIRQKSESKSKSKSKLKLKDPSWTLSNYHQPDETKFEEQTLYVARLSFNLRVKTNDSLKKVLDLLCIHKKGSPKPESNSDKSLKEIYIKIATDNNLLNKQGKPSFKEPIGELYKEGISIFDKNLVYHVPDFLIAKVEEAKKTNKKTKKNNKWVNNNREEIKELARSKKSSQDKIIKIAKEKLTKAQNQLSTLETNYASIAKDLKKLFDLGIKNRSHEKIINLYQELYDLREENFIDNLKIYNFKNKLAAIETEVNGLKKSSAYRNIAGYVLNAKNFKKKKKLEDVKKNINSAKDIDIEPINERLEKINQGIKDFEKTISKIEELRINVVELNESVDSEINYFNLFLYVLAGVFVIGIAAYIYFQQKKISSLSLATDHAGKKFDELEGQIKNTSDRILNNNTNNPSRPHDTSFHSKIVEEKIKTPKEIISEKLEELVSEYNEALNNFSKVAEFKQKWNGLALTRKERQDGTKTVLINSSRAFEKAEIWCLSFDDKYFALPGSSVKNNMATYMNLDFEKAQRDFKGVYSISTGTNYFAEPCVLRKGGAGFIVEQIGKLAFPQ